MGEISKDSHVTITFEADVTNGGSTGVIMGVIPVTIDPIIEFIAPGAVGKIEIPTLNGARLLKIEVDTPEPLGRGALTVLENNVIKKSRLVPDDTDWVFRIV